jgi:D-lactate dehydratase
VLTQAGFEMDIATETGTYCLDEISLTDPFLAGSDKAVFDNRKKLLYNFRSRIRQ